MVRQYIRTVAVGRVRVTTKKLGESPDHAKQSVKMKTTHFCDYPISTY